MLSETTIASLISLAVAAVLLSAGALLIVMNHRRRRNQLRLDQALKRARKVRQTGSGLQGTPYDIYGDAVMRDFR